MYLASFTQGPLHAIVQILNHNIGGSVIIASLNGTNKIESSTPLGFKHLRNTKIHAALKIHPRVPQRLAKLSNCIYCSDWHKSPLYHVLLSFLGMKDDLGVNLTLSNGSHLQACVIRDARTFSEKERTLFSLLLPHFKALLINLQTSKSESIPIEGLTRREQEILFWIAEGKTNVEAADILHISPHTVRTHLEHIYRKLGVENRNGAARWALEKLGTM